MPSPARSWLLPLATLVAAASVVAAGPAVLEKHVPDPASLTRIHCDLQHPLEARIEPLGPITRGEELTLELRLNPRDGLRDGRARVILPGLMRAGGPDRFDLPELAAGQEGRHTLRVRVPEEGHRFLVRVQVTGEGPWGPIGRELTYNILPDGPDDPGTEIVTADGRKLRQYTQLRGN